MTMFVYINPCMYIYMIAHTSNHLMQNACNHIDVRAQCIALNMYMSAWMYVWLHMPPQMILYWLFVCEWVHTYMSMFVYYICEYLWCYNYMITLCECKIDVITYDVLRVLSAYVLYSACCYFVCCSAVYYFRVLLSILSFDTHCFRILF